MSKSSFICVILCGVLVACLPRLVAPSDSYISDSLNPVATDNEFDLFPPFQPVYLDFNGPVYSTDQFVNSTFFISVPLDFDSYRFEWFYDLAGSGFNSIPYFLDVDDFENAWFISYGNAIYTDSTFDNFSLIDDNCSCYFICNIYDLDTDSLLHTYRFSYQFFDLPSLQNNSPTAALKVVESHKEQLQEQPQEEIKGGEDGE